MQVVRQRTALSILDCALWIQGADMELRPDQAQRVERARQVLAGQSPSMYELADMAGRIGSLEWHLEELLSLVGELTRS